MTEYQALLEKLFSLRRSFRGRSSIENTKKLSELLFHPEKSYAVIHIAGSNGKGSVATKISATLEKAGYKVGLYTSPHISSFRERILVKNVPISEEEVVEGLALLFSLCEQHGIEPTFFELATVLCFHYFQKAQIEVAVIETGLGGRLDATNIVEPLLCIITSLSLEHTELLGNTFEQIAKEKGGILKQGIPVVLGPKADCSVLRQKAKELNCAVSVSSPTVGFYDEENQEIARCALQVLKGKYPNIISHIEEGLQVRPSGRFERHGNVILDVAHNPDAFKRLFQALSIFYSGVPVQVIVGLSDDKDKVSCLRHVAQHAEHIYLVEADSHRATPATEMAAILESLPYIQYSLKDSVEGAFRKAQEGEGLIVICGSFYLMREAKEALRIPQLTDYIDNISSPALSSLNTFLRS